jgi:hypothetical protein
MRPSSGGGAGIAGAPTIPVTAAILAIALLVTACGGSGLTSPPGPTPSSIAAAPTLAVASTPTPGPSSLPVPTQTATRGSAPPAVTPSPAITPRPSATPGATQRPSATPRPTPTPRPGGTSVTVSDADAGSTVELRPGDTLIVVLESTYWSPAEAPDPAVLVRVGDPAASPSGDCVPGGGCGTITARFRAVAAGQTDVVFARTVCGEALACPPDKREFRVAIVVG